MSIYSFSTKASRPTDDQVIKEVKEICSKKGLNFSQLVVNLLREWEQKQRQGLENKNG